MGNLQLEVLLTTLFCNSRNQVQGLLVMPIMTGIVSHYPLFLRALLLLAARRCIRAVASISILRDVSNSLVRA
jgi:hypothetical protein